MRDSVPGTPFCGRERPRLRTTESDRYEPPRTENGDVADQESGRDERGPTITTGRREFVTGTLAVVAAIGGCLEFETPEPDVDPGDAEDSPESPEREDDPDERSDEAGDGDRPEDGDGEGNGDGEGDAPNEQVRAYERAIHEQVNEIREERELDALGFDEGLASVAREHSVDMAERDYFSHESPEGERPHDRLDEFFPGYCRGIGENIASVGLLPGDDAGAVADRVVAGWMASEGHRENLLREEFDEQGIGVAVAEDDRVLVTQNLCGTG